MTDIAAPRSTATPISSQTFERLALAGVLAVAAWLRLHDLAGQSLWWDEVMSWRQARLGLADLIAVTAEDNYPPLHNLILHFTMQLLGETESALRLPSAIFSLLDVAAVYWVGTLVAGRRAGIMAAGLIALSGFHLWYAGEARTYALLGCAATVFAGTVLRATATSLWRWRIATALAGTALLYSHPYGALTFTAIAAGAAIPMLLRRDLAAILRFAALLLVPAALFVPWLIVLMTRAGVLVSDGFWIPPLTPWGLVQILVQLLSGPFVLAAIAVGIRLCLPPRTATNRDGLIFLASWAMLPIVFGIVLSLTVAPMLLSRYLIGSLPPFLLLAGIGLARLRGPLHYALLLVAVLTGLLWYVPPARDDFRAVAAELRASLEPGDCVVMIPEAAFGLRYYYRNPLPCLQAARSFAGIAFDAPPRRIIVVVTMDADLAGIPALGTEISSKSFGRTRLVTLQPTAPANKT